MNKKYTLTRNGVRVQVDGMVCDRLYALTNERKLVPVDECSLGNPVFVKTSVAHCCDSVNGCVPDGARYLHDVEKIIKKHMLVIENRLANYERKNKQ